MSHITRITSRSAASLCAERYPAHRRDYHVWVQRHLDFKSDHHDIASERMTRWELRAQVRAAVLYYYETGVRPGDLSMHRLQHTDSIRREREGYPIPGVASVVPEAIRQGMAEAAMLYYSTGV